MAQPTIGRCVPSGVAPGKTTQVLIEGKDFKQPIRIATSNGVEVRQLKTEEKGLLVEVVASTSTPPGPFGLWVASADGVAEPVVMVIDDLATVQENASHHDVATAQELPYPIAVDGTSDGASSDFYRLKVSQSQRLAFDLLAQRIGSTMDGVLKLMDKDGVILAAVDDDAVGPDPRLEVSLEPGDYLLEVRDNRYASGGRYRLRVGDFPLVHYPWPLGAMEGTRARVEMVHGSPSKVEPVEFDVPKGKTERMFSIESRFHLAKPMAWASFLWQSTLF